MTATTVTRMDEAGQAQALVRARRRATGLLAVVAVAFVASFALADTTATGYLRSALEAGMVGGLADWFAVVALFRHPLGIPIPHTAVIPNSKEGLGANLATFVEQNFLDVDQVRARVADATHVERLGAWLAAPEHAERVASQVLEVGAAILTSLDEDVVIDRAVVEVRARVAALEVSALGGRALETAIREGRHEAAVTAAIEGLRETVERNRTPLRRRLGEQSPTWVPDFVDDLVFDRAEQVVRTFLTQLAENSDHELRTALDLQLMDVAGRLQHDAATAAKVDRTVQDALTDELLRRWIQPWWHELRDHVARAADPAHDTATRRTMVRGLTQVGGHLQDPGHPLHARVVAFLGAVAPRLAQIGQREVGSLIQATIDRWDAQDTSRRLELWMGRDLQFVRINGTVVGALVGVVLHALTATLA